MSFNATQTIKHLRLYDHNCSYSFVAKRETCFALIDRNLEGLLGAFIESLCTWLVYILLMDFIASAAIIKL